MGIKKWYKTPLGKYTDKYTENADSEQKSPQLFLPPITTTMAKNCNRQSRYENQHESRYENRYENCRASTSRYFTVRQSLSGK